MDAKTGGFYWTLKHSAVRVGIVCHKKAVKATFTAVKTVKVRPNSRIKYELL